MKKIYLFVFLCVSSFAFGQTLLTEDFDYTAGDLLTAKLWNQTGTITTNPIAVTSPGLTFAGYIGSGIGLSAGVNNTGQDVNKLFTAQTTGSVYASFMVNATAVTTSGYFFHFYDPALNTAFRARTFITAESDKMRVGLTFNASSAPTNMATLLNFGETYLFVAKYEIVDGTLNDKVSLYVFKAGDDFSIEPTTPTIGPLTGDATDITPTGISLRQFDAAQRITVDGFRVKTSWSDLTTNISPKSKDQYKLFYPNPVTDGFLNLTTESKSIKNIAIFDLVGKKVFNESIISNKVDISKLNAGIYLLEITADNQTSSSKLVIK